MKQIICMITGILTAISAINWGLVGAFDFNLVTALLPGMPSLVNIVYIIIGLAGVICTYFAFAERM